MLLEKPTPFFNKNSLRICRDRKAFFHFDFFVNKNNLDRKLKLIFLKRISAVKVLSDMDKGVEG